MFKRFSVLLVLTMITFCCRDLGASQPRIDIETRKLDELKGIIFNDFRKEVLNRIKKQGEKVNHTLVIPPR